MSWEWTYRPGEVVERSTSVGVIREQQPAAPHWPWLGETPTERAPGARAAAGEGRPVKYIEAPEEVDRGALWGHRLPTVFLAGGITGCEDWQRYVREQMANDQVLLLNPRRADFDVTRGDSAAQQVDWEWRYLHDPQTHVTLFWFPACDPAVTVQPIALFELGGALTEKRRIVVGAHPDYPRRQDIVLQAGHFAPNLVIHDDLDHVLQELRLAIRADR